MVAVVNANLRMVYVRFLTEGHRISGVDFVNTILKQMVVTLAEDSVGNYQLNRLSTCLLQGGRCTDKGHTTVANIIKDNATTVFQRLQSAINDTHTDDFASLYITLFVQNN